MAATPKGAHQPGTFLSLYGGVGHAAAFMRRRGYCTCEVDTCINSANSLGEPQTDWEAEELAEAADVVGLEIVCASWSLSRRAPVWSPLPHRLRRKGRFLMGLPNLPLRDRVILKRANRQVRSAVIIVKSSILHGKSGFLEQPDTSIMWHYLYKALSQELRNRKAFIKRCCMCGYGAAWKKPTRLLVWGERAESITLKWCHGKGTCDFSGKPHHPLTSTSTVMVKDHQFGTVKAQVYPKPFVSDLLSQLFRKLS